MAKTCLLATIVIVVSSSVNSERRSFLGYSKHFQKAVPHFWKHDQEELNRNLDKNSGQPWGGMRVGPHPPPLRPNPPAPWSLKNQHVEKESTQDRVHELKNKLIPNNVIHIRALNQPHPKPNIELKKSVENKRHNRDVSQAENDFRKKREVIINPQMKPEIVMQPHIQPALLQEVENQYQDKIIEKRDKRQILFMIKQQPLKLAKKPRTTPNPFIRDTNIADYDLVKPENYKPEVEVMNSVDTDSYQLNEEASEFSNILSNFYLTTSSENWPEIQKFAEKVLKPLSELLGVNIDRKYSNQGTSDSVDRYTMPSEAKVNRRVKRKLDKTLIRKRAKKRKQKQRRVERKRLRMLTHARRLRKQRKSKLARLERHYARMNLTTTAIPNQVRDLNISKKKDEEIKEHIEKGGVTIIKSRSYESKGSQSESSYYDSEDESEDEYGSSDEDESESDLKLDDGNDEYEDYEDESSTNSFEYVDYENVVDEPIKNHDKESNKKQTSAKETGKKGNKKNKNNNKRGKS